MRWPACSRPDDAGDLAVHAYDGTKDFAAAKSGATGVADRGLPQALEARPCVPVEFVHPESAVGYPEYTARDLICRDDGATSFRSDYASQGSPS